MSAFVESLGAASWLLPAMVVWPMVAAVVVRLLGRNTSEPLENTEAPQGGPDARMLTLVALVVEAAMGIMLWVMPDASPAGTWKARVDYTWLPDIGASISMGVDGMSMVLVIMTVLLMPLALLGSWQNVRTNTPSFGAVVLLLTAGLVGVFVSLDLLLFYLAWELMLIPTYLLIGIWGKSGSSRAGLKYVLFTFAGSMLMLVAVIALWNAGGQTSFHVDQLVRAGLSTQAQLLMFGAFFLAFAVKSALVPFHTWLPDAQTGAPTIASVALGIKVGTYAILRFAIPLFPDAASNDTVRNIIIVLSIIGIVYGAILAMSQKDFKRLVSYSNISHLGFIMLGCFMFTEQSVQGAIMAMLASGISTSALFLLAGMLQDRRGTTELAVFGGLARVVPWFAFMLTLAMLSTIGLPGTNGFIGEFLVLIGTYAEKPVVAVIATSGVIFAAIYGLRALQDILFARQPDQAGAAMRDLTGRELGVMSAFAVAIIWLGVAPGSVLNRIDTSAMRLDRGTEYSAHSVQPQRVEAAR